MRVLWFTSVTPPEVARHLGVAATSGPAAWVESLRERLSDRADLELAIAAPCSAPFAPFAAEGTTYYGMPVQQSATRIGRAVSGWRSSFASRDAMTACEEVVADFQPDLIHVHGTENPFGLLARSGLTPVVISLQGLLTAYERFYFRGLTSPEIARLVMSRDFMLGRGEIHGYWRCVRMAAREREILRLNRSFIGRTAWDRTVLWAVNPHATYHHCDEVLRRPFYRSVWRPQANGSRVVFSTSSTISSKGTDCLIEALATLHAAGYADVRLRVAGISPTDAASERLVARARKHSVAQSIDWLGRLDADQIAAELARAAVFAYPSHFDNSPNALCEALLVGVPSVASYVGGIPSLLRDGEEGLLHPPGDPYALAGRIRTVIDEPSLAARLGEQARARALRRHNPDSIVDNLLRIYGELVS